MLGIERKQLAWHRREDWRSHPQLVHRLEVNRFATELVRSTLAESEFGIGAWYGPRQAAARLGLKRERVRPDSGFLFETETGPAECYLEWDRGTETKWRLEEKLDHYLHAERGLRYTDKEPRSVLFVVPSERRLETLRSALPPVEEAIRERERRDPWSSPFERRSPPRGLMWNYLPS